MADRRLSALAIVCKHTLVHPNGSKYWRFKYRFHGEEKLLALGVYPDVPLAKVRERVQEARKLIADKTNPSEVRKREKRKARERACNTFEAISQEWFEERKGGWSPNHAARVLASLEKEVFPRLGHRPVAELRLWNC